MRFSIILVVFLRLIGMNFVNRGYLNNSLVVTLLVKMSVYLLLAKIWKVLDS